MQPSLIIGLRSRLPWKYFARIVVPLRVRTHGCHVNKNRSDSSGSFVGTQVDTSRRCVQCKKTKCYYICKTWNKALCIEDKKLVEGTMSCWSCTILSLMLGTFKWLKLSYMTLSSIYITCSCVFSKLIFKASKAVLKYKLRTLNNLNRNAV